MRSQRIFNCASQIFEILLKQVEEGSLNFLNVNVFKLLRNNYTSIGPCILQGHRDRKDASSKHFSHTQIFPPALSLRPRWMERQPCLYPAGVFELQSIPASCPLPLQELQLFSSLCKFVPSPKVSVASARPIDSPKAVTLLFAL